MHLFSPLGVFGFSYVEPFALAPTATLSSLDILLCLSSLIFAPWLQAVHVVFYAVFGLLHAYLGTKRWIPRIAKFVGVVLRVVKLVAVPVSIQPIVVYLSTHSVIMSFFAQRIYLLIAIPIVAFSASRNPLTDQLFSAVLYFGIHSFGLMRWDRGLSAVDSSTKHQMHMMVILWVLYRKRFFSALMLCVGVGLNAFDEMVALSMVWEGIYGFFFPPVAAAAAPKPSTNGNGDGAPT